MAFLEFKQSLIIQVVPFDLFTPPRLYSAFLTEFFVIKNTKITQFL